jgi:ethanolamine utilization protein EutN/carbon dioxide concentrating mechanism protein CcmL
MQIARVKGNVVSTNKTEKLYGLKLLIVVPIDLSTFEEKGQPVVAIDTVGAGVGEVVMLCGGSSSRQTPLTENKPSDMAIVAIIDSIEISGKTVFRKYEENAEVK